jgi:hypothetical protein
VTSSAEPRSAGPRTSLRRVLLAALGGAVVTWLLWHFAFGDTTGGSTVQAVLIFVVVTGAAGFERWSGRLAGSPRKTG